MGFFLCFVHIIFNRFSTSQCMVMISQMKSVPRLCQPLYNKIGWDLMIWRSWGSSKTFLLKLLTKLKIKIFHQNFSFGTTILCSVAYVRNQRILNEFYVQNDFFNFFSFNWVQRTLKCQRITFETVSTSNLRFLCWSQKNEKNKKNEEKSTFGMTIFPLISALSKKKPICLAFLQNLVIKKFQSTRSFPILMIWP